MISIDIDEATAEILQRAAEQQGLSVAEYLKSLVRVPTLAPCPTWEEFQQAFDSVGADSPSLPADFSRADIYADHD